MKILSVEKVKEGDTYTIKNEPIESINLMERAATACAGWIEKHLEAGSWKLETGKQRRMVIFCGLGNNGGDGLAIGRLLHNMFQVSDFKFQVKIEVFIIRHSDKCSEDFNINYEKLKEIPEIKVNDITAETNGSVSLPELSDQDIIIDAILGSGLSKPVKGLIAEVINHINSKKTKVISIDVPSGLFCDESSETLGCTVIKATHTLSFHLPKLAFMFAENEKYVGQWVVLPIGINKEYTEEAETKNYYTESDYIKKTYKPRKKFAHKGHYGHGLLISGSYGKMGAAVLASEACLRTGIGLLTTHIPKCGYNILQTAISEAMVSIDSSEEHFTNIIDISRYNAIAIGPGIGTDNETAKALKLLIQNSSIPLLFDADAINILGENKTWLAFLPKGSILTPHPKEFERIAGKSSDDFERNKLQREFSIRFGVYVVLKGAYTAITTPEGECYFNSTGNPGMATAGSGDVLTGIILSLLAQSYTPLDACIMGVYLHGLAGDFAADINGYEAMIAGDIIKNLGIAFKHVSCSEFRVSG